MKEYLLQILACSSSLFLSLDGPGYFSKHPLTIPGRAVLLFRLAYVQRQNVVLNCRLLQLCANFIQLNTYYSVRGVIYLGRRGRPGTNQQPDLRRATPHLLVTDIVVVSRVVRGACDINKVDFALVSIFWPAITFCRFGIDWHLSLSVNIRSFQSIISSMIEATLSSLQILDSITLFNQSVIAMFVCHLIA